VKLYVVRHGQSTGNVGGTLIGQSDHPLTELGEEQARAAALLGLPDGMHCEYVLSFGYPADESVLAAPKRAGGRRPLSELVHEERW